jgi:hypothetical protein
MTDEAKPTSKHQLRAKAAALGMTIGQLARQPAITRWYGVKPKAGDDGKGVEDGK